MSDASSHSRITVRHELRYALEMMEFAAFERIMKSLLYRSGYLSVQLIGRNHKRGRTSRGGLDLTARSFTELSSALTIAQVKQYRRVVSRRFVDELRGAMLRVGAEQGLLLTMSAFSKVAHHAAGESSVAPVKLIEGEEILDLLFAYRIGVCEAKGSWRLDTNYLDKLQKRAIGTYRRVGKKTNSTSHPSAPRSKTRSPEPFNSQSLDPQSYDPLKSATSNEYSCTCETNSSGGEMTWSTHLMAGLNTLWLLEVFPITQTENFAVMAGATALGSLLPDLDASQSKIRHLKVAGSKPFYLPAEVVYHQLGHRSLLHSLVGLIYIGIVGGVLAPFIGWQTALALWLGYASHLVADSITKSGIPFYYPRLKRFHLLPKGLRLTTGSLAEEVIFVLLSLSILALLLRHLGI